MSFRIIAVLAVLVIGSSVSAATYHVAKNGSDTYNGLSWTQPWATLTKVNSAVGSGDTVFFGTGTWRGYLKVTAGTPSDRTVYACSSFAAVNGAGRYHFAKIWGSDSLSGWTQYSGNIYTTPYTAAAVIMLAQGEHLFVQRQTLGEVNTAGEYYIGGGTLYAYVYNDGYGYDPDYYDMEASNHEIISVESNATMMTAVSSPSGSYVTIWGLELKYASNQIVSLGEPTETTLRSFRLEHCRLSHVASDDFSTNNPTCIFTRRVDFGKEFEDIAVVACSLGYSINHAGSTHGTAITVYTMERFVVDSCVFFGSFTGDACVQFKSGYDHPCVGNVVKHSLFVPTTGTTGVKLHEDQFKDSVYGNYFVGCDAVYPSFQSTAGDSLGMYFYIYNNTVIDGRLITTSLDYVDGGAQQYKNFKYNLVYRTNSDGDEIVKVQAEDPPYCVIDSNLYCIEDSLFRVGVSEYALSTWRNTYTFDVRSRFVSSASLLGFADEASGDYSRPDVSTEMNLTYGGKTWTLYGAWQPGDGTADIDVTPPATVFDLGALPGDEHGEMTLSWTAAGDDLWDGTATRYEIMWSLEPITENLWTPMLTGYDCVPGGGSQEITVAGLEAGRVYFVAVKTYDETGQASGLSNYAESFAGGIVTPPALVTAVDEGSQSAVLSCAAVTSYYDPLSYDFALTDSGSVDTTVLNVGTVVDGRVSAVFGSLSASSSYYWRCRAVAAGLDASEWSASRKFRLSNVVPDPPTVNQPGDFDTLVVSSDPVTLTVNAGVDEDGPNPLTYQFELYDSTGANLLASDSNVVGQDSVIDWALPVTLTGAQYHWRARCFDGIDYSSWMEFVHFQLVEFSSGGLDDDYFKVIAYPNPVRFTQSEEVTFRLPETPVDLFIQTISGETVRLETGVSGDWVWNGENESGNTVSIGIYLWYVRGTDQHGKIVVRP